MPYDALNFVSQAEVHLELFYPAVPVFLLTDVDVFLHPAEAPMPL